MERQEIRDQATAEKVNALLSEAEALGISTTRRQARKMLQGRGGLGEQLREARKAREEAKS